MMSKFSDCSLSFPARCPLIESVATFVPATPFDGRSNRLPLALALRSPAFSRQTTRLRSSSVTTPESGKHILLPAGVDVSICSESENQADANGYHVKLALVSVGHESIKLRAPVFCAGHPINVLASKLPASPFDILR